MSRHISSYAVYGCLGLVSFIMTTVSASPRLTDQLDEYRPSQGGEQRFNYQAKAVDLAGASQNSQGAEPNLLDMEKRLFKNAQDNPTNISALQDYGFFLININQRSAGLRYLDRAIQLAKHPHQKTNIILGIARLEISQGTQPGARKILSKLLENPTMPPDFAAETHFLLGLSYYQEIFFEGSRNPTLLTNLETHWRRTLSLNPEYTDWRDERWNRSRIERVLTSVRSGRRSPHGPRGFGR